MKTISITLLLCAGMAIACTAQKERSVGGPCEECDLMYAGIPKIIAAETALIKNEPGEPMIIEGTIFKKDGKTPAPNVILYVYHTDAKGYYSNIPGEKEIRHGHLRGWMKTDAEGHYKFLSIRPAPYPQGKDPAHIHPIIKEEGMTLYYIDEFLFEDDPLLTEKVRSSQEKRGGNGIIQLTKKDGRWYGKRDIILGQNIPGYQ
jgi:protocatechuate 3,4-dioxygenase, beta subunit